MKVFLDEFFCDLDESVPNLSEVELAEVEHPRLSWLG